LSRWGAILSCWPTLTHVNLPNCRNWKYDEDAHALHIESCRGIPRPTRNTRYSICARAKGWIRSLDVGPVATEIGSRAPSTGVTIPSGWPISGIRGQPMQRIRSEPGRSLINGTQCVDPVHSSFPIEARPPKKIPIKPQTLWEGTLMMTITVEQEQTNEKSPSRHLRVTRSACFPQISDAGNCISEPWTSDIKRNPTLLDPMPILALPLTALSITTTHRLWRHISTLRTHPQPSCTHRFTLPRQRDQNVS